MSKLVFIKKEDKKVFLNILGGPITFYQKGGHVLQKENVWSPKVNGGQRIHHQGFKNGLANSIFGIGQRASRYPDK